MIYAWWKLFFSVFSFDFLLALDLMYFSFVLQYYQLIHFPLLYLLFTSYAMYYSAEHFVLKSFPAVCNMAH